MTDTATQPSTPKRLLRSSLVVGVFTMLSRVLGLARDILFALFIGAAGGADAFFVAFKIPNFLRRLFAEGAFAQAFVPVLSEYRQKKSHADVRLLIDHVSGCLGLSVIVISALAVIGAPVVTMIFAPGFYFNDPEKYQLTVELIRITFPYLALISLAGFIGSILNSYDRFAIPALTPVILNLVLIGAALFTSHWFDAPSEALAWGVLVAGVLQLSFQIPFLAPLHLLPRPKLGWRDPAVVKVLKLMVPALFGVSVAQINLLLDTVLASFISDGSPSWLFYSDRLIELPLGVFGIAIATVVLPALSRQHTDLSSHYSATLDWAMRTVLLIGVPAACALVILAQPIIETLFFHGERFGVNDVLMSSYSLMAYALGLPAFMLIKVLATGYFSRQDTMTPVRIAIKAMVANMVFNVVLVVPLYSFWQIGHVGLALATSMSAYLNAYLLWRGLHEKAVFIPQVGWGRYLWLLGLASLAMLVCLFGLKAVLPDVGTLHWWYRIGVTAIFCVAGFSVFCVCLFIGGWRLDNIKPRV